MPLPQVRRHSPKASPLPGIEEPTSEPESTDEGSLDEMTKDELYELAQERDIEGRSSMSKDELLDALR